MILSAQSDYFLFLQSENNQPYYVQTAGKTHSSSSIGHLIISGLKDSSYSLHIGFPSNIHPEQLFLIHINKKDAGYQLKNLGVEGWALFNIQTLQLIKGQRIEQKKQTIAYGDLKKTDVFSILMAGLVNDSAVLYTSIVKVEPIKESSKASLDDTPNKLDDSPDKKAEIVKEGEFPRIDSSLVKLENTKKEEKVLLKDSSLVKTGIKHDGILNKDLTVAKTEPEKKQEVRKDSTFAVNAIPKNEEILNKDTASTKVTTPKPGEIVKNGTPNADPVPNRSDELKVLDSVSGSQSVQFKTKQLKPLIVWFSETKTTEGTELIYFDMSLADKTDTIRILILNDSKNIKDVNDGIDSKSVPMIGTNPEEKKEDPKKGEGKFLGKLFGKKKTTKSPKSEPDGNAQSSKNTSTVKVTTVENNNAVDPPVTKDKDIIKKEDVNKRESQSANVEEKKNEEPKTGAGKLIGKIFGKKNNSRSSKSSDSTAPIQAGSSIKVTNVDSNGRGTLPPAPKVDGKNKLVIVNSDCRVFASDTDVEKLRVRMVGENDADGQVTEARKVFKTKCFSTQQIKTLSQLFPTDEGKYKLFDAAYPFVSDTSNFKELVILLSQEYYINRFKAMVRM